MSFEITQIGGFNAVILKKEEAICHLKLPRSAGSTRSSGKT